MCSQHMHEQTVQVSSAYSVTDHACMHALHNNITIPHALAWLCVSVNNLRLLEYNNTYTLSHAE